MSIVIQLPVLVAAGMKQGGELYLRQADVASYLRQCADAIPDDADEARDLRVLLRTIARTIGEAYER